MEYYTNNSAQPQRKLGRIISIVVLVLLVCGGVGFYMLRDHTAKNVANKDELTVARQFTDAVLSGKGQESYDLMTSRAKKSVGSKDAWIGQLSSTKGTFSYTQLGSKLVEQPEASYGKDAHPVRINYTVKSQDGHEYDYYVIVTLENNVPKIDEFDTYTK